VQALRAQLARARREGRRQLLEKGRLANRMALLVETLPGGVVVLDGEGVVQECNPAAEALLGEPLAGKVWREVVARAFAPRPDDGHDLSLANGRRVNIATCSLGREPGQILLIKDVTETRWLQERIAHLSRLSALGEMAAGLAHQVRTPLASALLYAGMLGAGDLPAAERQRFADRLKGVLGHLEGLVRDMLVFARRGGFEMQAIEATEIAPLLSHALEAPAERSGVRLDLSGSAAGTVRANRDALASACANLLENAVQAGARAVCVGISRPDPAWLEIRVADDGPGIARELRERVFDPFFTTRSQGTGLGLAVARGVVESHGGRMWLHDTPAGEGAVFSIVLPLVQEG
jgi:two-component system sensor histidine kinase FlrB